MSTETAALVEAGDGNDAIAKTWFEDDDEETLTLLLSKDWSSFDDMASRLQNLAVRFGQDLDSSREDSFWQKLTASANDLGFASINNILGGHAALGPSDNNDAQQDNKSTCGCPSAFESEAGMKHIRAVASFLDVSNRRAIQLTMSALRTIHSSTKSSRAQVQLLPSLLGTQLLLRQVIDYYYSQRLFRLCVIAECLRLEQGASASDASFLPIISNLLNSLDATFRYSDGRHRGLYRRLLTVVCEPHIPPTLTALTPAMELQSNSQTSPSSVHPDGRHRRWNQFISDCVESSRFQKHLERSEAMEVLIVLLYERIQSGVQRDDYICLLLAFRSIDFFTQLRDGSRLPQQAGLVCAECMSLWRIFSNKSEESQGSTWAFSHPLLAGVVDSSTQPSDAAVSELEILQKLLQNLAEHAMERRVHAMSHDESTATQAPESLALLSFGLLLSQSFLSYLNSSEGSNAQAYWQTFRISGFDMAKKAGNEYGALDCFQSSLVSLIGPREADSKPSTRSSDTSYDWLFDGRSDASYSAVEVLSTKRIDAMSIAYSILGREVLAALVATFQDTILSLDHPGAAANIGMLCDLAAVVYWNEETLCEPFLSEWSLYSSTNNGCADGLPLCYLMDVAYKLATAAVNFSLQGRVVIQQNYFLPSVAPLLRFVSSLCYNSDIVESVLFTLPPGLIRRVFLHAQQSFPPTEAFFVNRIHVLDSISTLLRIGTSHSCRKLLTNSLEVEGSVSLDAPRLILRTVENYDDVDALSSVLSITADLLQSSNDVPCWALNVSSLLLAREANIYLPKLFSSEHKKVLSGAAKVLLALTDNLSAVVVSKETPEKEKSQLIGQVLEGILASFDVLTSSLSTVGQVPASYSVVETILWGISSFLTQLQPILQIDSNIHSTALEARDIIINALVVNSSLGEAIAYFAVAPISFHLAVLMDDAYQNERMLGQAHREESSTRINQDPSSVTPQLANNWNILQAFSESDRIYFNVKTWTLRKWIEPSDQYSIFGAASAAVSVLKLWALHVEKITVEKHGKNDHPLFLDGEARSELLILSPQGLLSSLVVTPPAIRRNTALSVIWSSLGCSNIELLMGYFKVDEESHSAILMPTVAILDLLAASVAHLKLSEAKLEDSALFQILRTSPFVRPVLRDFVLGIREMFVGGTIAISSKSEQWVKCCLRALRVLHVAIDKNLMLATALLDERKKPEVIQTLLHCVRDAITLLQTKSTDVLCQDDSAVLQMRLASGCLDIVQSIWKCGRALKTGGLMHSLFSSVTKETSIFTGLWKALTRFVASVETSRWQNSTSEQPRSVVLVFFASVLDIFTAEMAWWFQNKETTSEILVDLFRNGVDLVAFMNRFTKFSGYESFLLARKRIHTLLEKHPSLASTAVLLSFPPTPSKHLEPDFFVRDNPFDVFAASEWFSSVLPMNFNKAALKELVSKLAAAKTIFSNECHFFRALVRFSGIYSSLKDHDGVALARATLQWVSLNADAIEASQAGLDYDSLLSETVDIVCESSKLVLNTTKSALGRSDCNSADTLTELLVNLSGACDNLFLVVRISPQTKEEMIRKVCISQQCLLASAIAASQSLKIDSLLTEPVKEMSKRDQAHVKLTVVACKVLGLIEGLRSASGNLGSTERGSFLTCVSLMQTFLARKITPGVKTMASDSFLLKFSQVLREFNVIRFLVIEAHRAAQLVTKNDSSTKPLESTYHGEQTDLREVASVVNLLHVIVESSHPDLLSMFVQGRAADLITRNPLITFASAVVWNRNDLHQRGYLPDKDSVGSQGNKHGVARDDPVHALWMTIMATAKKLLCISNAGATHDPNFECFVSIAVDFINTNRFSFISCVKSCSVYPLTLNILREASSILSLLSEACARGNPNRIHSDLHRELSSALMGAIACISNFLGASGAAHELFKVLDCVETSGDSWDESSSTNPSLQSAHPLLAAGLPNARHEGIRYAHFASQCLAVMTQEDYKDSSALTFGGQSGEIEPQSPSTIEKRARNSMNSDFHRRMEHAAAECLFHALLVMWRLHPAASSFVMLSPNAASQTDTWSLIKPGMLIAYHCHSDSSGLNILPEKIVRVARVLHVDTVYRAWHVRVLRSGSEDTTNEQDERVQVHQLVGIENLDKRRYVLQFTPAPDLAFEVEQSANSRNQPMALGHLILVLRWCSQERSSATSNVLVQQLAELIVVILGAEVSLYREISAGDDGVTPASKKIDEQLWDLFGDPKADTPEPRDVARGMMHQLPHGSRLDKVLSSSVLKAASAQLGPELRQARMEAEAKRRKQAEVSGPTMEGGLGFGGFRKSSSAFRGLRVPLD